MKSAATALVLLFVLSSMSVAALTFLPNKRCTGVQPIQQAWTSSCIRERGIHQQRRRGEIQDVLFNHPILGFNRPAELFVIDAMVNTSASLTITVENIGTATSGTIDVNVLLLHDDYDYFEFANSTVQMAALQGGSSTRSTCRLFQAMQKPHPRGSSNPHGFRRQPKQQCTATTVHRWAYLLQLRFFNCVVVWKWLDALNRHIDFTGAKLPCWKRTIVELQQQRIAALTTPVMDMSARSTTHQDQRCLVFLHWLNGSKR